jgi:hypothetical protein
MYGGGENAKLAFTDSSPYALGIIFPLYGDYISGDVAWEAPLKAAKAGIRVIAILRPTISDLPEKYEVLTNDYRMAVRRLVQAGVICLGHVETNRGSKNFWTLENEVSAYAEWRTFDDTMGLSGVFFDHSSLNASEYNEAYFEKAAGTCYTPLYAENLSHSRVHPLSDLFPPIIYHFRAYA